MTLLIIIILTLFILWNTTLFGYKDRAVHPIETDESQVFGPEAKSIVLTKKGNTKAILLVHGFPSTPSTYSYSSERFHQAEMDVYAPLLPGFGSDPKIFEKTTFTQWFDSLCRTYEQLRGQYETLFVLGISMGGMMSLKLGETYCDTALAPDAIVSIAAPVVYNSLKDGIITDWRQYFMRTLALFTPSIGAKVVRGFERGEDGSDQWYGYGGLFLRPGLSLIHAMKGVRRNLHKITCPLFVIHDKGDRTVPFKNFKIIVEGQKSTELCLLATEMESFDHNRHALLAYHSVQAELTSTIIEFLLEEKHVHEKA